MMPVKMKELSAMLEKWSRANIRQHSKAEMPMPNPKSPMSANQSPIDVHRLHKYTGGDADCSQNCWRYLLKRLTE